VCDESVTLSEIRASNNESIRHREHQPSLRSQAFNSIFLHTFFSRSVWKRKRHCCHGDNALSFHTHALHTPRTHALTHSLTHSLAFCTHALTRLLQSRTRVGQTWLYQISNSMSVMFERELISAYDRLFGSRLPHRDH